MQLKFGSLFAGIGGFDLGFERAGMVCKWQVEIDDYATQVLAKHWPNVHRWRDVRSWPQPDTARVDVICGGFPCQDISYAGRGAGLDGERSGLFFEAIRVVRELQPRIVVLENVAALLNRGLDRVLGTLAEIGFDAEWHCIPVAAFGAPHIRDRAFILGYANSNGRQERQSTSEAVGYGRSVKSTGRDAGEVSYSNSDRGGSWHTKNGTDVWTTCQEHEPTRSDWWQAEPDVGRVANGVPSRVDRLRCLGNAVVPQVAEYIGRRLMLRESLIQGE